MEKIFLWFFVRPPGPRMPWARAHQKGVFRDTKMAPPRSFQKVSLLWASNEPVDWPSLAQRLAACGCEGRGSAQAMAALELMIGEEAIRQAIDYYVAWKLEAELARNVLWRLRP